MLIILIKIQNLFIYYLILFFLGSVLMRSAGCIFNDIVDKDFDKKVRKNKKRPISLWIKFQFKVNL